MNIAPLEQLFYAWLNEIIDRHKDDIDKGARMIDCFAGKYPGKTLIYHIQASEDVVRLFIRRADGTEFEYRKEIELTKEK